MKVISICQIKLLTLTDSGGQLQCHSLIYTYVIYGHDDFMSKGPKGQVIIPERQIYIILNFTTDRELKRSATRVTVLIYGSMMYDYMLAKVINVPKVLSYFQQMCHIEL